jgi:hypothetical protein
MGRRHRAESKGCPAQSKVEVKIERIRSEVPRDESQVSVGGLLALGYGREVKIKKEKVKSELRGRHSNCHWVEVSKRAENMERSTENASRWMKGDRG